MEIKNINEVKILALTNRIALLNAKDSEMNKRIVNKLQRQLRRLEEQQEQEQE